MVVHATAGYGDPGFDGQYTLEVTVMHPLRVYSGMRVAQMRFHTVVGEVDLYRGSYAGDLARGPVASTAYRQFLPKETAR
jgi:dCTP deaminase